MKSLLMSLLFGMNSGDTIAFFTLIFLFVIFIVILYKNIKFEKVSGILNSVEETSVPKLISVYPNNPLSMVPATEKKIIFEINCHGKIVKILSDPGNYVQKIKEKVKKEVKIVYIRIKFLRLKVNFVLGIE